MVEVIEKICVSTVEAFCYAVNRSVLYPWLPSAWFIRESCGSCLLGLRVLRFLPLLLQDFLCLIASNK
jgi:hypothetical protein